MMTETRPKSPTLLQKEVLATDHIRLHYQVPSNLLYFEGHFKNAPVVAGVVQLQWVAEAIAEHLGETLTTTGMEAVKFHQLLFPDQVFELDLQFKRERHKFIYKITSGGATIASGRFVTEEVADG